VGARVILVDSGLSNLDSAARALEYCGASPEVTRDPGVIAKADRLVLPGVGAFPAAMRKLTDIGVLDAIEHIALVSKRPVLGICLGMQLLAEFGTEMEQTPGLGLVAGDILPLKQRQSNDRVPHIGWNIVHDEGHCSLLAGIAEDSDFYFVHSYHFQTRTAELTLATTPSFGGFAAIVGKDNVFGTQFHPEKSQAAGFQLLKNFLAL
jgi:imidazole glycerol-phosphate synthase subunit HisH